MSTLSGSNISQTYQGLLKMTDSTSGVTGTLQTVQTGDGTNTPLQISQTQVNISGSLTINGTPVTNVNTGSFVTTSSFNAYTSSVDTKLDGLDIETGSLQNQINGLATTGSLSGYTTVTTFNNYTSSNDTKVNDLISKTGSYATTGSNQFNGNQSISGSVQVSSTVTGLNGFVGSSYGNTVNTTLYGDTIVDIKTQTTSNNGKVRLYSNGNYPFVVEVSGSLNVRDGITGSLQGTASFATNALSASYAPDISNRNGLITTGSIGGSQSITGSLNVEGTISATSASITYLETVYETASVIYSSGSNQFGDASNDTQTLFGTVVLPNLNQYSGSTSSDIVTWNNVSQRLEYTNTVPSSSYAENAGTSSFARDIFVVGKNTTGVQIDKGTVVRIAGSTGDQALIVTASWEDDNNSANTLGILSENVANDASGSVITNGTLLGINTSGFTAGDILYLSSSGQYTNVIPPAPYHEVRLGQVLRVQQNQGSMYVSIQNGYELSELHDVDITSPVVGDLLVYRSGSYGQWVNETGAELGFATTGSNTFNGNQSISGSLIVSGSETITSNLQMFSPASFLNSSVQPGQFITSSSPVSQSNVIFASSVGGTIQGFLPVNFTGSIVLSGSNNIIFNSNRINTLATAGTLGYVNGVNNIFQNIIPTLNTGSTYRPTMANNIIAGVTTLTFTTSSLFNPNLNNNLILGNLTANMTSGSVSANQNVILGSVTLTHTVSQAVAQQLYSSNFVNGASQNITNFTSSIVNASNNNFAGASNQINNYFHNAGGGNNTPSFNRNMLMGQSNTVHFSGSTAGGARAIGDSFFGGYQNEVSASVSGSNNSSMEATFLYGRGLVINANAPVLIGGSAFVGRFNDTGSLSQTNDIVFAVGTGTGGSNRRTGLYIDSGSNVVTSGSFSSIGNVNITGSLNVSGSGGQTIKLNGDTSINGATNVLTVTGSATIQHSVAGQNALTIINSVGLSQPGLEVQGQTRLLGNTLISGSAQPLQIVGQSMTNVGLQVTGTTTLIGNTTISGSDPLRVGVSNNKSVIQSLGGSQWLYRDSDNNTVVGNAFGVGNGFFAGSEKNMIFNGFATDFATGSNNVLIQGGGDNFISGSGNVFIGNHNGHAGGSNNILIGGTSYSSGSIFDNKFELGTLATSRIFHKQGTDPLQIGDDTQVTGSLNVSNGATVTGSLNVSNGATVTGSVNITNVMNLTPQNPLPSGNIGDLAVSSSNQLYFYNGAWTLVV